MNSKLNKMIGKVMEVTGKDYDEVVQMSVQELNEFNNDENIRAWIPSVKERTAILKEELQRTMRQYKHECDENRTTIIITNTEEDALYFNAHCKKNNLSFYAVAKGQSLRGFHDKGKRPNTVIMLCDYDNNEKDKMYFNSIIESLDSDYCVLRK